MNKTNYIRLLTAIAFVVLLALPLSAQEKKDSVFRFRFFSGRDMFFVPVLNNGGELTKLFDFVDQYKENIAAHKLYLAVDGYYLAKKNKSRNRKIARTRSNRVKSELITRKGLKEENFITHNQAGDGNYVVVSIVVPKDQILPSPKETDRQIISESEVVVEEPVEAIPSAEASEEINEVIGLPVPETEPQPDIEHQPDIEPQPTTEPDFTVTEDVTDLAVEPVMIKTDSRFALKTNLLMYGILMPNIEVEWKFAEKWSVALEGQRAWYAKESPHKVYRIGTVIPEVRYWPVRRSMWHGMYVGVFGGLGMYDLSKGKKGHEGEGAMGGISAGYMWPIGKYFSLDAGIGVGYLYARDKEYLPRDGHFLYQLTKKINYFGPLRLKLSLVWRIQCKKNQSLK